MPESGTLPLLLCILFNSPKRVKEADPNHRMRQFRKITFRWKCMSWITVRCNACSTLRFRCPFLPISFSWISNEKMQSQYLDLCRNIKQRIPSNGKLMITYEVPISVLLSCILRLMFANVVRTNIWSSASKTSMNHKTSFPKAKNENMKVVNSEIALMDWYTLILYTYVFSLIRN